ncbi:hypothetical protein LINPERHAP1_LOCUS20918, partial [Linum perenne]
NRSANIARPTISPRQRVYKHRNKRYCSKNNPTMIADVLEYNISSYQSGASSYILNC